MRPTGKLHLGHLVGALGKWAELQDQYECFYFVADWHALTSEYANTEQLTSYAYDNVTDWIAAGIDPAPLVRALRAIEYRGWLTVHQPLLAGEAVETVIETAGRLFRRLLQRTQRTA